MKIVSIYRIVSKNPLCKDCYIGSTENLPRRKYNHHTNSIKPSHKEYNKLVYQHIRDNGGWDNWEIIEIEKYNATDLEDRRRRERYWLEYYEASLNKNTPFITKEETIERNRENMRRYYDIPENAERHRENMRIYQRRITGYYERHPPDNNPSEEDGKEIQL